MVMSIRLLPTSILGRNTTVGCRFVPSPKKGALHLRQPTVIQINGSSGIFREAIGIQSVTTLILVVRKMSVDDSLVHRDRAVAHDLADDAYRPGFRMRNLAAVIS